MSNWRKRLGTWGERMVEKWYIKEGYTLLERNYRCRMGEIDLIFVRDGDLYFVEVRTKSSLTFGTAEESVDHRKRATIFKVSQHFLLHNKLTPQNIHFDVAAVYVNPRTKQAWIKRYPDAF